MRQDLQIDAGLIHLTDAQCAKIVEPLNDVVTRARTRAELPDLRVLIMFFERDDVGLLCHSCPPIYASRAPPLVRWSTASGALPAEYSGSALVVDSFPIFRRDRRQRPTRSVGARDLSYKRLTLHLEGAKSSNPLCCSGESSKPHRQILETHGGYA